jgi:glycosyltransferase involved in cell wall biosynthesis
LPSPQISVVIPVYNGEAFVADAIDSVLAQQGVAFELIVIDDGSTDATPAILARYGDTISVYRQSNAGEGAARNAALPHMRGELALFLDADDLIPQGYLGRFASAASQAPEIEVFHCGWRAMSFDGELLYTVEEPQPYDSDPFHQLLSWGSPHVDAVLVRRSVLERVGGFDPTLRVQADFDFCMRLATSGARFRGVPGNVAIVRRREDSISAVRRHELAAAGVAVMERHLAGHTRCPACKPGEKALRLWRRRALLAEAAQLAQRTGLSGHLGNWIGMVLAVARRPRRIGLALDHAASRLDLTARWRRRGGIKTKSWQK